MMMTKLSVRAALVVAVQLCWLHTAEAQVATEELARRLVGEGIEAAKSRDWVTARDRFQRAYEIQPIPLTLYNLAAAQEKTGQFVEADRAYRIFLRESVEGENDRFREAAAKRRVALRSKIAYVVVRADGIVADDVLMIDDREIAQAVLGESIPSNPGQLVVRVLRGGQAIAQESLRLSAGQSQVVTIAVPPPEVPALPAVTSAPPPSGASGATDVTAATTPPAEEEGGVLSSPWFWGVAAVVVLAGAGAGVYFGTRPNDPFDSSIESVSIVGR